MRLRASEPQHVHCIIVHATVIHQAVTLHLKRQKNVESSWTDSGID